MTDEAELLQRLRNREKNSIDEAIRIYTPYKPMENVFYWKNDFASHRHPIRRQKVKQY